MTRVLCREDFQNATNKLLFNVGEKKLYPIKNYTTSTVHVYEYPLLLSKEISNDIVFANISRRQGYLKWINEADTKQIPAPDTYKLKKLPMRCAQQYQYLIPMISFDWNKYVKWSYEGGYKFVEFIDDIDYDIEQTWLNRNVMNFISVHRLLNTPNSDEKYYRHYVMEHIKILKSNKCSFLLNKCPNMLYPCVEEQFDEVKHLLKLKDEDLLKDEFLVSLD